MENSDYKVLVDEYEKLNIDRPDMYPLTFSEYVDYLKKSFSKPNYLAASKEKQIEVALLWMRDGHSLMKYYNAFKLQDMQLLNNVLFETAQLMQICNISSTGTDHGFYGMKITPNLLAANMMERVKLVLPEENGLGNYSFAGTHIANLLMTIIYKDFQFKERALELSERELSKKVPEYIKCWIKCMRAIVMKDCEQFNEQLVAFCKAYMKCKEFGMNGFNRRFCVEAHGLYNLAIWAYDGELKENIVIPQVSNFCQELALFQMKGDYSIGKIVHIYPESLDICNKIMCCDPPKMFLVGEGKKRVIDVNRFAQDVIDKIDSSNTLC